MDAEGFRKHCENMVSYIIDCLETFSERSPNADGYKKYMESLKSKPVPSKGEPFEKIMDDFEKYIMQGLSPVNHPVCHAFQQCNSSFLSILTEMLGVAVAGADFNWNISPFGKHLESIVFDWYGSMIGLPDSFLYNSSNGGSAVHDTIHESIVICMVTARQNVLKRLSRSRFSMSKPFIVASLVAYCTKEAEYKLSHAVATCMVILRIIDTDENFCMKVDTLAQVVQEDIALGLMPFFVNVTLGNIIGKCDSIDDIATICEEHDLWLNVDASYAGNALVCSEYRHYIQGIEFASSLNVTLGEWLMVHHDCVFLFVKHFLEISNNIMVDMTMLNYGSTEEWSFSSQKSSLILQLCLFIRSYGSNGLEKRIRNSVKQTELFKTYMAKDEHFSILNCNFGKLFFRLKSSNDVNEKFLKALNISGKLLLNHTVLDDILIICFDVCSECSCEDYVKSSWNTIKEIADKIFEDEQNNQDREELFSKKQSKAEQ